MDFRLVDTGWDREISSALSIDESPVRIICPFIKKRIAERFMQGQPKSIQIITRFNLRDFVTGVSDIRALQLLLQANARIRGVRNLHAKLYLFGKRRAILTSANLTDAALSRNHEFGLLAEHIEMVDRCEEYFQNMWKRAGEDLEQAQLIAWQQTVGEYLARGGCGGAGKDLADEGTDVGIDNPPLLLEGWGAESDQAFVKFFGQSNNRAERSTQILEEVRSSGSHWACSYPRGKRPRSVKDGAIMFIARLVKESDDIMIYGRAVAMAYEVGRDDATTDDITLLDWKSIWPHYARVHHAEFINGTLADGVSHGELMAALGANAFASTQLNLRRGSGNTDPRRAYMRQAAVELTQDGLVWLNERIERAFNKYGKISLATLAELDWSSINYQGTREGTKERGHWENYAQRT